MLLLLLNVFKFFGIIYIYIIHSIQCLNHPSLKTASAKVAVERLYMLKHKKIMNYSDRL